jgi:hypothetical protein
MSAPVAPPATRLTPRELARLIFPRRRRRYWALAIAIAWALAVPWWALILTDTFVGDLAFSTILVVVALLPAIFFIFPAVPGVLALAGDRDSGRLASLRLTLVPGQDLLAAYRRRATVTGLLVLAILVPSWMILGRAPYPLIYVPSVIDCHLEYPLPLNNPKFLAGLVSDVATVYLAATLGIAALVWTRSRGWALVLGPLGALLFGAAGWVCGWAMAAAMKAMGLPFYRPAFIFDNPEEPGYTLLLWSFATAYSLGALLVARAVLHAATRHLDRLVAD